MERKVSKKNDPDGPLPKWGEPESVKVAMKATPGQGKKAEVKEAKYSVDVEGLPRFYMDADSPAQVKVALRKLLKKASSIDSVERVNDAKIKQDLRKRLKGAETDKRYVDEKLDPRMGVGEYIKDFRKSDAPQFKGKPMKKKTKMALAAYLSARREKALEEKARTNTYNMSSTGSTKHKVTITKKGDSLKPKWHLSVNGKDHGEHDSEKSAIRHFQKTHAEGYSDPFKAAARSAKYKELSHEYEREKQLLRKQKAQKSASQNKSFSNVRSRMDEARYSRGGRKGMEPTLKMMKAADALAAYGKKHGDIDKDDFMMASMIMRDGDMAGFEKFIKQMDTDPRDGIMVILKKHGLLRGGKVVKEEEKKEKPLDEVSRTMTPMRAKFGAVNPELKNKKKDISVADYKKKTGKKTVSLKHLTKNTHINPFTEESVEEEASWHKKDDEQKVKGKDHQTLHYTTRGGQKMKTAVHKDKAFAAVGHFRRQGHTNVSLGEGRAKTGLATGQSTVDYENSIQKHMKSLKKDPKNRGKSGNELRKLATLKLTGHKLKEGDNMEEGMVRAVSTARRMAGNMTGAAKKIDKMKPKKKGGDFSDNPRVQKKLQKYNENFQSFSAFVESSCGGSSSKMRKEAEQKLSGAQKKHMDTDKDGDIDAADMKNLRNKKKS